MLGSIVECRWSGSTVCDSGVYPVCTREDQVRLTRPGRGGSDNLRRAPEGSVPPVVPSPGILAGGSYGTARVGRRSIRGGAGIRSCWRFVLRTSRMPVISVRAGRRCALIARLEVAGGHLLLTAAWTPPGVDGCGRCPAFMPRGASVSGPSSVRRLRWFAPPHGRHHVAALGSLASYSSSQRGVERLFKVGVHGHCFLGNERQELGVDGAGDAAGRVDPEMSVEQPGPGAGASLAGARYVGGIE